MATIAIQTPEQKGIVIRKIKQQLKQKYESGMFEIRHGFTGVVGVHMPPLAAWWGSHAQHSGGGGGSHAPLAGVVGFTGLKIPGDGGCTPTSIFDLHPPPPNNFDFSKKTGHQKNFGEMSRLNMGFSTPKQEVLESTPQYQKIHHKYADHPPNAGHGFAALGAHMPLLAGVHMPP